MAGKVAPTTSYVTPGRLADVMTLIQILAFDPSARRSGDGLAKQLSRPPLSAASWTDIARLHPEFFRVLEGHEGQRESVSLVARFVLPAVSSEGGEPKTPSLSPEVTGTLMNLAIQLHDREVQRRDRWKAVLVPTVVAVIAAAASITAAVISTGRAGLTAPTAQPTPAIMTPSVPALPSPSPTVQPSPRGGPTRG